jgi:hypothetical protein
MQEHQAADTGLLHAHWLHVVLAVTIALYGRLSMPVVWDKRQLCSY